MGKLGENALDFAGLDRWGHPAPRAQGQPPQREDHHQRAAHNVGKDQLVESCLQPIRDVVPGSRHRVLEEILLRDQREDEPMQRDLQAGIAGGGSCGRHGEDPFGLGARLGIEVAVGNSIC